MNRSKFFLGTTAFLLTVAGVYATKVAKTSHKLQAYTKLNNCHFIGTVTAVTVSQSGGGIARAGAQTLFTQGNSASCGRTIRTVDDNAN